MARQGALPAELYSDDSDCDEFGFSSNLITGSTTATNYGNTSNLPNSPGYGGGFPGISGSGQKSSWTVGGGKQKKKGSPPKSKIPVAAPTNNGVNIEDFRLAIIRGNTESAKICIEQGVDVNVTFKTGWTPLMYASHQINESLMTLLLSHGATPNLGTTTALMTCCTSTVMNKEEEIEKCINLLVTHGADVNALDKYTMSPLMMASKKGHIGAVRVLLDSGADVNQQERRGFSPLCWACTSGNLVCIKTLVEHGADINVKTSDGLSPVKLSQSTAKHSQILAYFTSLPGFQKDKSDDGDLWIHPTNAGLSNGANANLNNGNEEYAPPEPPTASAEPEISEDKHVDAVYNKFGDLEILLYGLDLSSLIPLFQTHDVTLDHLLNISDDELIKVGVQSVGHRKKILDSVHELHKKDWQPSSIPSYEKVKYGKQLSCAEVTTIIANVATHSACITASLKYVTSQVHSNPSLLQVDKHGRGLHALRRFLHEMNGNSENQVQACAALKTEIEQTLDGGEAETVDHITRETTNKSGNRLIIYSTALITIGVISLGVYVVSKKFPYIRLPFSRLFDQRS